MNAEHFQRWGRLSMAAMALIMVFTFSGCGSSSPVSSSDQYVQKVYIIGEIKDPETSATEEISEVRGPADAVKHVFVNRVAYDGVSADAPIFMAADQVLSLSDTMRKGLLNTYRNSYPIIVVRGGETQINALLGILGLEQNYMLPESFPYAELFAISTEPGVKSMWSMFPPGSAEPVDGTTPSSVWVDDPSAQLSRAAMFRDWINQNGAPRKSELKAFKKEAIEALAADGASESDLTKVAMVDRQYKTFTDPLNGNVYQLIYRMYSCHSFNTMDGKYYDWFYVEQEGSLSPQWKGLTVATMEDINSVPGAFAWGGQNTARYIGSYTMSSSMMFPGGDKSDDSVRLETHSPQTNNTKTTTRSGVSFNIGGDVGFKTGVNAAQGLAIDANAALKTGVTINNEKTVETYDCTVSNKSLSSGYYDDAKWLYAFPRVDQYGWYAIAAQLYEPVRLSRDTFQPLNKWIWRFSPDVRDGKKSYRNNFSTTLEVENLTSISGCSVFWIPVAGPYHLSKVSTFKDSVPLNYPPLIVAPSENVTFNNAGQVKYMDVHVTSDWSASSDQSWCQAVPTTGKGDNTQVSITVDNNTTGKERKATITFSRNDGRGKDTMTVTQSQFEKIGG